MFRTAVRTKLGRRKEAVYPQDFATRPGRFVFDKGNELVPTSIGNGFGKVVISQHAVNVETFKGNRPKGIDNGSAQFVVKVFALIDDLLMNGSDNQLGFPPAITALDLAGKSPLSDLQAPFGGVEVLGLVNFLTVAERGKSGQAQVNPNPCWLLFRRGMFNFALDGDEIFTGLGFRHGTVFHLTFYFAMENSFHPTDLWQVNVAAFHLKPLLS